jgi:hypothetical protein
MEESQNFGRRHDVQMAAKVQCGIALQFVSAIDDARRYLVNCGAPLDVIERVLSYPSTRHPSGAINDADRRNSA